jgi:hypothetical protein
MLFGHFCMVLAGMNRDSFLLRLAQAGRDKEPRAAPLTAAFRRTRAQIPRYHRCAARETPANKVRTSDELRQLQKPQGHQE